MLVGFQMAISFQTVASKEQKGGILAEGYVTATAVQKWN